MRGFLERIVPFLEILKLKASPIDVFVVLASCSVVGKLDWRVLPAIACGILMHSSGDIINDIYDREIDKICKPEAVIPSGRMSVRTAWIYLLILTSIALIIATWLSTAMLTYALAGVVLGFIFYSHPRFRFKDIPILGSACVAACFPLESLGVCSIYSLINYKILLFSCYIFFLIFSLIFLKDFRDVKGDRNSVPIMLGVKKATKLCCILLIVPALFLIVLFLTFSYKICFAIGLICYLIVVIFIIQVLLSDSPIKNGQSIRHRMIAGMTIPNAAIFISNILNYS